MRARPGSGVGTINTIPEANLRIVMQPEPESERGYGPLHEFVRAALPEPKPE